MELGTAIALFEYDSIAAGIESGDDMVKRAPLQVIHAGTVHPGKYLVLVSGSVGDVEEALAAAELRNGKHLMSSMFLPDPHPELIGGLAGDDLAALAGDGQGAVPSLQPEVFNVGVERLGDPQTVQCQQASQPVVSSAGQPGLDQEHAEFVAIQPGGVRFIVQLGAA